MSSFVILPCVMSFRRCSVVMFCILDRVWYRITSFGFCCRVGMINSSKWEGRISSMRLKPLLIGIINGGLQVCFWMRLIALELAPNWMTSFGCTAFSKDVIDEFDTVVRFIMLSGWTCGLSLSWEYCASGNLRWVWKGVNVALFAIGFIEFVTCTFIEVIVLLLFVVVSVLTGFKDAGWVHRLWIQTILSLHVDKQLFWLWGMGILVIKVGVLPISK